MAGTAVAAVAMAALTASQAPGVSPDPSGDGKDGRAGSPLRDTGAPGDGSYHTELPPLQSPPPTGGTSGGPSPDLRESGIPATVLDAYQRAERSLAASAPGCGLRWELLAAIGKVESGQARGGAVDADGTTVRPIRGPVLNGSGFARVLDTDGGRYDGDSRFDRAVGPMQFIPSTWQGWGADGNGDGVSDPNNVYDAALAAGRYLCAGDRDLTTAAGLDAAVLSYNHSRDYLRTVLAWYEFYREGTHEVPNGQGVLPTTPGSGTDGVGPATVDKERPAAKKPGDREREKSGGDRPGDGNPGGDPPGDGGPGGGERPGDGDKGQDGDDGSPSPAPGPEAPAHLAAVTRGLTAEAGTVFAEKPRVKATTADGAAVRDAEVVFEIVDAEKTGARFSGDNARVGVRTAADGVATAPALTAGDRVGTFVVRATLAVEEGADLTAEFTATVEEARDTGEPSGPDGKPDELTVGAGADLTTRAGTAFPASLRVTAKDGGKAAAHVRLRATMVTGGPVPVTRHEGPYFKDAGGRAVRDLGGLTTDVNGVLRLPKLFADDRTGTFTLLLRAPGGERLPVRLTVTGG